SRVERLSFKLLAPNVPGDVMVMQGRVAKLETNDATNLATVEFAGRNSRGFHVTGTATLALNN
ncbi:MAG: acyl dehydratase, partial [Halioglobus sp.]|nr:acyl dehydratase [Halioglobus sp.]